MKTEKTAQLVDFRKLMMAASWNMQALMIQRGKEALATGSKQPSNDSVRLWKEMQATWSRKS